MKVYLLERDIYEDRYIQGVYATLEQAKAAAEPDSVWTHYPDKSGDRWSDQHDFGKASSIMEYEVEGLA